MNTSVDYGGVLRRAWQITWRHKILWIFGILAGCSRSGSSGGSGNNNVRVNQQGGVDLPPEMQQFTRGLAEVIRLAVKLGADPLTVTGLAGLGDLVLTCTGELSRNRSVGLRLGKGEKLSDILAGMKQVAEGVRNTLAVDDVARAQNVEMPITAQMRRLLFEDKPPREAMVELMTRQLKHEF